MNRKSKSPLAIGLLNMLVPGSCFVLVKQDWRRFIGAFIGGVIALGFLFFIGAGAQQVEDFPLPQGLTPVILILFGMIPLFISGQRLARENNSEVRSQNRFLKQRTLWQVENETRLNSILDKNVNPTQENDQATGNNPAEK